MRVRHSRVLEKIMEYVDGVTENISTVTAFCQGI